MITILTPTRDRPEAFQLCCRWVARQTTGRIGAWVVVDDGDTPVDLDAPDASAAILRYPLVYLRRTPSSDKMTLQDNILYAMSAVKSQSRSKGLVFFEDDEWYAPDYAESMADRLQEFDLVGERGGRYYHVGARRWREADTPKYASLCRTAITPKMFDALEWACKTSKAVGDIYVDYRLWGLMSGFPKPKQFKLVTGAPRSVAIKGMPGRSGAGTMHNAEKLTHPDPDMKKLQEWIGIDAAAYAGYYSSQK